MMQDWRTIKDDKEKYQAYLCSREWAELRMAVIDRANGKCERCYRDKIQCVHHLTYARKYDEGMEDLQGLCDACHSFIHGRSDVDPVPSELPVQISSEWNGEDCIVCPLCGFGYVSIDHYKKAGGKSHCLEFVGECGHSFQIRFEFWKGFTNVRCENITSMD